MSTLAAFCWPFIDIKKRIIIRRSMDLWGLYYQFSTKTSLIPAQVRPGRREALNCFLLLLLQSVLTWVSSLHHHTAHYTQHYSVLSDLFTHLITPSTSPSNISKTVHPSMVLYDVAVERQLRETLNQILFIFLTLRTSRTSRVATWW